MTRDGELIESPVSRWAECRPETPALIGETKNFSYAGLARQVVAAIRTLREAGVGSGDTVATWMPRTADHVVMLLGIWHTGAIAAPLSTRLPVSAVAKRVRDIGAQAVVTNSTELINRASEITRIAPPLALVGQHTSPLPRLDLSLPCTIVYTSGSSGEPKPAVHTLANHHYSALGSNQNIVLGKGDSWLLSLPLYHVGGLAILFRCLLAGSSIRLLGSQGLTPGTIQQCTHLSLVPTQLKRLIGAAEKSPASLKAVLLGGGPIPGKLVDEARTGGWPIHTTYGLTEMSSQVTTTRFEATREELLTAGKLLPYRELKLDSDGEIHVRGKTLFAGYLDDGQLEPSVSECGWFRTGDMGRWDTEGRLIVAGRKDQMFVSGGENIQPEEIEQVLQSCDLVQNAVVVGKRDDEFGQRPVAFVSWTDGAKPAALESYARQHLPGFKIPTQIHAFPREFASGMKPQRANLRAWLEQAD